MSQDEEQAELQAWEDYISSLDDESIENEYKRKKDGTE